MDTEAILRQAVRGALAVGAVGGMVGAGAALAQTAAPAASTAPAATQIKKIIVTGSHIPQTSVATAQPILTITKQQIEATGFTSLGQVLRNLSQSGASFGPQADFFVGPYSSGYEDFNLKNLGSNRTLILVNGHRWAPTLGGAVDLSSIPVSIIQRIEILLNGASAIYGSDAIAGVVNIITDQNFNGAEASAYYGGYNARGTGGGWDGATEHYSMTLGTSGSRGAVLLSAGYRQFDPIWNNNRSISKEPLYGFGNRDWPAGSGKGLFLLAGPNPKDYPCFYNPKVGIIDSSCVGPFPNPHRFQDPGDRHNRVPHYLTIPSEDWYGYAQGHFDLTPSVTFTSTVMYRDRNATQILSPTPMELGALGIWHVNGLNIGISKEAPNNPFGTDLIPYTGFPASSAGAAAWCQKYGSATGGGCLPNSDLLFLYDSNGSAYGGRTAFYDSQTWLYRGGFNGFFSAFGNQWTWDVSYGFTRNRVTSFLSNSQNTVKMQEALGPNCTGSCVPLDLFRGKAGITKQMVKYVNTTVNSEAGVTQRDYTANLAGNFFNGWYAGPWGVAVGAEYLDDDGFNRPSQFTASGNTTSNSFKPTGGKIATRAEYGELKIPLAHDLPGAKDLTLDLANRWSQFKTSGITGSGADSASTGRVNIKWRPIASFLVRASWSESFREPSISELFGGQAISYNNVHDPCIGPGGVPPKDTVGCPTPSPTNNYQIPTVQGGNAQLTPETAISRSAGFVWSPTFAPGLNIHADYYKIEITNAVGTLPESTILQGCYIEGFSNYCDLIHRSGPFITRLKDTNINTGSLKTNGWDIGVNYRFPTTSFGQFSLKYNANFMKTFVSCNSVLQSEKNLNPPPPTIVKLKSSCHDYAGDAQSYLPKKRMDLSLNWDYGPWSAYWNVELIGQSWEDCANSSAAGLDPDYSEGWCSNPNKNVGWPDHAGPNNGPSGQNHLGTTVYNDVSLGYTVAAWHTTFTLGCNNVFQKDPPIGMDAFINNYYWYYYRIPGRFVYARAQIRF